MRSMASRICRAQPGTTPPPIAQPFHARCAPPGRRPCRSGSRPSSIPGTCHLGRAFRASDGSGRIVQSGIEAPGRSRSGRLFRCEPDAAGLRRPAPLDPSARPCPAIAQPDAPLACNGKYSRGHWRFPRPSPILSLGRCAVWTARRSQGDGNARSGFPRTSVRRPPAIPCPREGRFPIGRDRPDRAESPAPVDGERFRERSGRAHDRNRKMDDRTMSGELKSTNKVSGARRTTLRRRPR